MIVETSSRVGASGPYGSLRAWRSLFHKWTRTRNSIEWRYVKM